MPTKRMLAALVVLFMLFALVSCTKGENDAETTTNNPQGSEVTTPGETENPYKLNIPDVRYDGYVLNIANDALNSSKYVYNSMMSDGISGDVIKDAIYTRNLQLSELLGVTITESPVNTSTVRNLIQAGEQEYDLITVNLDNIPMIIGFALDFNQIETVDLDMPWWDQNAKRDLSIGGKLFYTYSDAVIFGLDNTRAVYFNQDMYNELMLEDAYTLVEEGRWTMDKMIEYSQQALRDDGDGVWTAKDTYGFVVRAVTLCEALLISAEIFPEQVGNDGMPYTYCYDNQDRFINVFLDLMKKFDTDAVDYRSDAESAAAFQDGLCLYYMGVLKQGASLFRGSDLKYGILPKPKYTEDQDRYYCVSPNGHALLIPYTNTDPERTGVVLEAMSYYSSNYYSDSALMPSYFTITQQGKTAIDPGSYRSLQIIHDSLAYELKYSGTQLILALSGRFEAGKTDVASLLKTLEKIAMNSFDNFLASINMK